MWFNEGGTDSEKNAFVIGAEISFGNVAVGDYGVWR